MFARLVMSSPSTWAAVNPSASAARRPGRESATSFQLLHQAAKGELITVGAKAADDADGAGREHRMPALRLAGVHVADVNLDVRNRHADQRVTQRETRMRVRAGVHDGSVDFAPHPMNRVDQLPFTVVLDELQLDPRRAGHSTQ